MDVADVGDDAVLVHDERRSEPGLAFMRSRLARGLYEPTPTGVLRAVDRPDYGTLVNRQVLDAQQRRGPGNLTEPLRSGTTGSV